MCRTRERGLKKTDSTEREKKKEKERERKKKEKEREREREGKCPREEQGKTTLPTPPPLRPATLSLPDRAQCNSLSTHVLSILPFLLFFASAHPIFIIFLNFFIVYQFSQLFSTALVEKNQKCCSGCMQEHCLHFLHSFSQPFSIFLNQPLLSQYLSFLLSFSIF